MVNLRPGTGAAPMEEVCTELVLTTFFFQIKCSSLVKSEHIPGTQDKSQPLFSPYLPNCFKGRIFLKNMDKCFIFPYPHSWNEPRSPAEIFPPEFSRRLQPTLQKIATEPVMVWQSWQQLQAGFHSGKR